MDHLTDEPDDTADSVEVIRRQTELLGLEIARAEFDLARADMALAIKRVALQGFINLARGAGLFEPSAAVLEALSCHRPSAPLVLHRLATGGQEVG